MKMHAEVHTAGNQPIPVARCGTMDEVLAWSWAMAEESRRVIVKRGPAARGVRRRGHHHPEDNMRRAAQRDTNEGAIRKRFAHHGWHTEQVSQEGKWDLDAYPSVLPVGLVLKSSAILVAHVDVKLPDGRIEELQVEKWTALHKLGIPVYVARTEADVDAIVSGTATPWNPDEPGRVRAARKGRAFRPGTDRARTLAESCKVDCCITSAVPGSSPPRCAAHLAGGTFAPPACPACRIDPQSPCKHDGGEKGVAAGTQPPRRTKLRKVDAIIRAREETERITASERPRRSGP